MKFHPGSWMVDVHSYCNYNCQGCSEPTPVPHRLHGLGKVYCPYRDSQSQESRSSVCMSWKRDIGDDDHEEESVSLGSSWDNQQNVKPSTSIERIILINIIKGHSKSSLGMW
jgi:hypothetical protein